jgi:hypothetical protein
MPELLGYNLGGAENIPPEIFEGDDILGDIFEKIFHDKGSPLFEPQPGDPEYDLLAGPDEVVSDGEFILNLITDAAEKISRNNENTAV